MNINGVLIHPFINIKSFNEKLFVTITNVIFQPHNKLTNIGFYLLCFNVNCFRGIEGIVIDYVRPVIFGHFIPKITLFLVYLLSILTLAGLLNFNHNNMGLSKAIRRFWTAERYIEEDGDIPPE